jgi:PHD/YefM family antitoxin component YafN of YafNO toxin-antitoxin module
MRNAPILLEEIDVRYVVDGKGNKKEVIIPYDKFRELMQIVEDYNFLHSPEIQEQIRQSEEDIKAGKYTEFEGTEISKTLDWLHEK